MDSIQKLIHEATTAAHRSMESELTMVPLDLWNESVYRYHWVKELLKIAPKAKCQIEWNYNDLFFQLGDSNVVIEFKFYITQFNVDIEGRRRNNPKGHPSNKNFEEFCIQVGKLDKMNDMPWFKGEVKSVTHKILILVYTNNSNYTKKQFKHWYDNINLPESIEKKGKSPVIYDLKNVKLEAFYESKDDTIFCERSANHVYCKLFEIS